MLFKLEFVGQIQYNSFVIVHCKNPILERKTEIERWSNNFANEKGALNILSLK